MELVLLRTYHLTGTNGKLYNNNSLQCFTIELPWKDNQPKVSCIPEGRYELKQRYSPRFSEHLLICGVKDRSFILIHPANNASKELRGCIAPVTKLTGQGRGIMSKPALRSLLKLLSEVMKTEKVYLIIKKDIYDNQAKGEGAHS
jgi:hypothetical protein